MARHVVNSKFEQDQTIRGWVIDDERQIFRSFLGGAPILPGMILKTRVPICTKLGENIVRSSLHTQFKNIGDILLGLHTTMAQNWALLSDKAKNRTFWPPCKN